LSEALLEVRDLVTSFRTEQGTVRPVDRVSFDVPRGQTVGLVGESGCGKSVTSLSIMGLIPAPAGRVESGSIRFEGRELVGLPEPQRRALRGREIAMIFQEPMSSLNPVYSAGQQIGEAIRVHERCTRAQARARAIELLRKVGIPAPEERVDAYPHQLSGGMRQRVMIAIALALSPKLLIADEPTTALDVTIQAQILDLLSALRKEMSMGILLITHDLGVVAEAAQHVVVMYAGRVVERASTVDLFEHPRHPYTRGLLQSVPTYGENLQKRRLPTIAGLVPDLLALPGGCRFRTRCPYAVDACAGSEPELVTLSPGHDVACIRARELSEVL